MPSQRVERRYTRWSFRIGLPAILFFVGVSWMGVWYAADQIMTERAVYQRGVVITGTVVEKILLRHADAGEQAHYVAYQFRTPVGTAISNKIRIESAAWHRLTEKGPIAIRYVPDRPELNLPDGWRMQDFYYLVGGITLAGALFFSVVLIGMLVKKLCGGYRD